MPNRTINAATVKPATAAMLDTLADGDWHDKAELLAVGASACITHEPEFARRNGERIRSRSAGAVKAGTTDDELLRAGAHDIAYNRLMITVRSGRITYSKRSGRYRMLAATRKQWLATKPDCLTETLAPTTTASAVINLDPSTGATTAEPSYYRTRRTVTDRAFQERSEWQFPDGAEQTGWDQCPLQRSEMVHFKCEFPFSLSDLTDALPSWVRVEVDDSDGLYRVWGRKNSNDGDTLAERIFAFFDAQEIWPKGLKVERDRRRRELGDMPDSFVEDLCRVYGPLAMKRIQKHMTTIRLHIPDNNDIQQHVYEWLLKAITTYDATKGVPFGAFLTQRLRSWVFDLPRARAGRGVADAEMNVQRAVSTFEQEHHRAPNERELAEITGQPLATVRRNAASIQTLANMRNPQALDLLPDSPQVQVTDGTDATVDVEDALRQTLISSCFTSACTADEFAERGTAKEANPLGWLAWYMTNWGGLSKTELSEKLGTSMRNLNVYQSRAEDRMRESLAYVLR